MHCATTIANRSAEVNESSHRNLTFVRLLDCIRLKIQKLFLLYSKYCIDICGTWDKETSQSLRQSQKNYPHHNRFTNTVTTTLKNMQPTKWLHYLNHSSRIRFLRFFLKIQKKRDFLRFFEAAFQKNIKNVIQNAKFQTLPTFHYMESPLQLRNNVCL